MSLYFYYSSESDDEDDDDQSVKVSIIIINIFSRLIILRYFMPAGPTLS